MEFTLRMIIEEPERSRGGPEPLKYLVPYLLNNLAYLFLRFLLVGLLGLQQLLQLIVHNFVHSATCVFVSADLHGENHEKLNHEVYLV